MVATKTKNPLSALTRRKLRKLANFLETHVKPDWFDLDSFATRGFTKKECGSTACALGWATVCFPKSGLSLVEGEDNWMQFRFDHNSVSDFDFGAATNFFNITMSMALCLFDPEEYESAHSDKKEVIERLRSLASTGKIWN